MTIQEISQIVSNIGLPSVILLYLTWRLDKFLTFICGKLETYNNELSQIAFALTDIVEQLKGIKNNKQ